MCSCSIQGGMFFALIFLLLVEYSMFLWVHIYGNKSVISEQNWHKLQVK